MLAFANQIFPGPRFPNQGSLVAPLFTILISAVGGFLLVGLLKHVVPRIRRGLRTPIMRRRQLRAAAIAEVRARAMMDELCPHGWQAEIVLFSSTDEVPPEAPDPDHTRVQLDWAETQSTAEPRRIWAHDLRHALDAMVADRTAEETLHQIEQQALADGVNWNDL